jgi:mannose-6-phosphate isomerase-like protein (cupin superfamily)
MIYIHAKDVKSYWSKPPHHRELKVLLSPKIHKTSPLIGMGMVTIPPGESGNPHQHGTEQETWYILSGSGKLQIGKEEIPLEPEMVVVAPQGIEHQILNTGDEPLKALFIFSPAGPEEAFLVNGDEGQEPSHK